jgi:hypothetical protein
MAKKNGIERDEGVRFHEKGTLRSVTRWITTHDQGIAELLKNSRRAYFPDRGNVKQKNWVACLMLRDKSEESGARIGLLDVGGATEEDVEKWSVWQDPQASERAATKGRIEETQGQGGKAYMFNLFKGPTRILGVCEKLRNCKGLVGEPESVARGTPGYIPDKEEGKNCAVSSFWSELDMELDQYDLTFDDLPEEVKVAIDSRQAFTLVEGVDPREYHERIPAETLIKRIVKNPQSLLPLEQMHVYVLHNGRLLNEGKALEIESLKPYPGFETPRVAEIPESLPDENGTLQSTTNGGTKSRGRLEIHTSEKDISKRLKYRWAVTYKTTNEVVGSISVGEIVSPGFPAAQFLYATIELDALDPEYVRLGRDRPNEGPLLSAMNIFTAGKIEDLAREINNLRKKELDEGIMDEIHEENVLLDNWKNRFFNELAEGLTGPSVDETGNEGEASDLKGRRGPRTQIEWGVVPEYIDIDSSGDRLLFGQGVTLHLSAILKPIARDSEGNPVPGINFEWWSDEPGTAGFPTQWSDELECRKKGSCRIWIGVSGTDLKSEPIQLEVWEIDHVLLTPRRLEIPLGTRKKITSEVTNDEGKRSTQVLLNWKHDALDQLRLRLHPTGWITGNREGNTTVTAGGSVWSRIGAEVDVIENPDLSREGEGFPRLLLTNRDIDPETGMIREGDPDREPLWQEVSDWAHNIWWLNLQNPQAAFVFDAEKSIWRLYHAEKVVEMMTQALMQNLYTQSEEEKPDFWGIHKDAMCEYTRDVIQMMWRDLSHYVKRGKEALI